MEPGSYGRVVRLEVQDFKSYRGTTVIGPFHDFTTIIGPNGSGKSNVMDAISFVLGVRTAHLRGSLSELLYFNSDSQSPEDRPKTGRVTLVFQPGDPGAEEVHFTRAIVASGDGSTHTSQYRINGKQVTLEAYNTRLEGFGVLVKARTFLVFQGDIENVAQMRPLELTAMFEQISGSAAYKEEYERADQERAAAEARLSVIHAAKKSIAHEKKQKKEEKEEADRAIALQKEIDERRATHFLWSLFHLRQDELAARQEADAKREGIAQIQKDIKANKALLESQRRQQASLAKKRLLLETRIRKMTAELDRGSPDLIRVREELSRGAKRLASLQKQLEEGRHGVEEQRARHAALERQLESLNDALAQLDADVAAASSDELAMSETLLAEYARLKAEVGAQVSALELDRAALSSTHQAEQEAQRLAQASLEAVDARIAGLGGWRCVGGKQALAVGHTLTSADFGIAHETLCPPPRSIATETERVEAEERLAAAKERVQELAGRLATLQTEREGASGERRRVDSRREALTRRAEDLANTIREARADKREGAREQRTSEVVAAMRRQIPGVHGFVHDLADVVEAKWKLALAVVMGRDFDAVVVDTDEVGMKCIQYAKEQRVPPITFLPIASLRVKDVDERQGALPGSARLALQSTLVCHTVEEARELAFGTPGMRRKVVAMDGTLINKSGIISGGVYAGLEARAQKWDRQALENMKQQHADLEGELARLPTARQLVTRAQELETSLTKTTNELHFARVDVKAAEERVQEVKGQLAALTKERAVRAPLTAKQQQSMKARAKDIERLTASIHQITDRVFASFSRKVGVKSIREWEQDHLMRTERASRERLQLTTQISKLTSQLEYDRRADISGTVAGLERDLAAEQAAQGELNEAEAKLLESSKGGQERLAAAQEESASLRAAIDELDASVRELKVVALNQAAEVAAAERALKAASSNAAALAARQVEVAQEAEREQVPLPRMGRAATPLSAMEEDGEEAADSPAADIDFGALPRNLRSTDPAARGRFDLEHKEALASLRAALARLAPNLRAAAQFEAVRAREREHLEELEAARRAERAAAAAFAAVRAARHDAFTAAFEHVAACIDPIYKARRPLWDGQRSVLVLELTSSAVHPSGGQAYLALDSADEPFCAGVKFSAMPPTKRFRDMEALSGGEKTVAALALLFAVLSFRPCPFFVMDEVDAALDAANVVRVANYLRHMTRRSTDGSFQGIVISLKDSFYDKADALVGVCRHPDTSASATFTLDLNAYGDVVAQ
ncbi:Structural maintenance of chromosomes protein 1A [Auxenochlorella protothecoides]|uniref:Structural maintenance of chromosomes protein n=1 Tax=Auxenochlorella protothecoides TaxID=3075 RepID=A0A087SPX0_AUXPR|nr:Structural maintenance of chromosomes protein 1A [Auxenochlorella protothecoides]KFM27774.1 Structural maintenance of chromosomes protein 1A [Auxenochlorella protothecoides]